ncbi:MULTISPECIES: DUF4344 domain-containing metallopeptidase [unclassified Shewanella]|uniref:DUF4344 domain-containing metallopeptidase n=1 Tax=unclassified Shewanella TaxID=196818 RepID=UPI0006E566C0|nr:DUF4344 domain-containing metallopeptidase [Shewanella sp. P1-14-1]KPZ67819.1 hypothetical protein AN944_03920 [Shewanella sp. P1-14-1]
MNKLLLALIIPIYLLSGVSLASEKAKMSVTYLPASKADLRYQGIIKRSEINQLVQALAETYFTFNNPLQIEYGSQDGPLYDPNSHTIHIPYSFIVDSIDYFSQNAYMAELADSAEQAAVDALLHTLLHEIAHAYIADNGIPILGKEEDAADNFAAIIMLNYIDAGDDALLNAADLFALESEHRPDFYELGEYIDEHSFDLQRYFSSLCLVYGSEPEKYPALLNEIEKDYRVDRKSFCIEHFQVITKNWQGYFAH